MPCQGWATEIGIFRVGGELVAAGYGRSEMIESEQRQTARLLLRRIAASDAPAIVAIQSDPRTNTHRPGGAPPHAESEQAVDGFIRCWREHGIGYWVVELAGEVVGVAGLRPFDFQERECWNLYYRFAPSTWGQGLAVEAASEAVAVAQAQRPPRPVVARTRPSNLAALRVAENAGLIRRPDLDADDFAVLARCW